VDDVFCAEYLMSRAKSRTFLLSSSTELPLDSIIR